jgi:hypothetical protein
MPQRAQRLALAAALVLLASQALALDTFRPFKKACPPGCEQHGNCNIEEGRWAAAARPCSTPGLQLATQPSSTPPPWGLRHRAARLPGRSPAASRALVKGAARLCHQPPTGCTVLRWCTEAGPPPGAHLWRRRRRLQLQQGLAAHPPGHCSSPPATPTHPHAPTRASPPPPSLPALPCRCECPWGYGGDDCSRLMMPACRQLPESKWVTCDDNMPKNCEVGGAAGSVAPVLLLLRTQRGPSAPQQSPAAEHCSRALRCLPQRREKGGGGVCCPGWRCLVVALGARQCAAPWAPPAPPPTHLHPKHPPPLHCSASASAWRTSASPGQRSSPG